MNQKTLILAVGILAGAAAAYLLPKTLGGSHEAPASEPVAVVPQTPAPPPVADPTPVPDPAPAPLEVKPLVTTMQAIANPPSAWARLAEKYGAEKTTLSSKITSNLTSVINEGIDLAKTAARNSGSSSIEEAASKEVLRNAMAPLQLTEGQQKEAAALVQSAVTKRMAAVTDLTSAMSAEPEQVMEMLLAGDALARKEISQQEYDRITQPTRAMLQKVAGFVAGGTGSGGAGQMLMDGQTLNQLNAILTPEQQSKLTELTTQWTEKLQSRQASQDKSGMPFQLGQIPILQLDKLDQSVTSVKQMAEAARLMMEAMKGIKEANAGTSPR